MALTGGQTKFCSHGDIDFEGSIDDHDRIVISSSDDESDHLEKRAKYLSSTRTPSGTQTPPRTGPEPTRHGRPRRVISSRSSESSIPEPLLRRKQSIESPTKSASSRPNSSSTGRFKRVGSERLALTMTHTSGLPATKRQTSQGANMDIPDDHDSITSDSDEIVTPARRRPTAQLSKAEVSDDGTDDIRGPMPSPRKRFNRVWSNVTPISDGTDSSREDVLTTPGRKGRLRRGSRLPKMLLPAAGNDSMDDLQEDLEDLKETGKRISSIISTLHFVHSPLEILICSIEVKSTRTRGSQRTPKKTKAQEQLELLRRRRAGEKVDETSGSRKESRIPSRNQRALYDTTDDNEEGDEPQISEEEIYDQPIHSGENLDEYDEDFVIEDEDSTIGAPADLTDMPFEFTRHAHKKPIEHFKDAVEWMVHNKLNPAFPRDDASYQVAFRKLDDEVQGLAGSKFMSAAWSSDFLTALKSRPEIAYLENTDPLALHHCAACNKSNHPAKFQLIFSGKPYDRRTLETLSDDSNSDTDSRHHNNDEEEPDTQQTFHVGRTCCANAETAHALHHWRYALNHWVLAWLRDHRYMMPEKIVQRERWTTKRKSGYANDVVDGMVDSGEMRLLYKEFKENLQAARDARNERFEYGRRRGRGRGR